MKLELTKIELVENENGEVEEKVLESKTYISPRLRGAAFQRMLEIKNVLSEAGEDFGKEHFDLMAEFICYAFGDQFNVTQLLDEIELEEVFPTFQKVCDEISNRVTGKLDKLAKN